MRSDLHYTEIGAQAYKNGNYRVAGRMFLRACKEAQLSPGPDNSVLIGCYYNLALFYYQQHRHRKAEITLARALNLCKDKLSLDVEIKFVLLLIDVQKSMGSYRKALKICKRMIERITTENGTTCRASHPPVYDRLISLYMLTSNAPAAEKWCRDAIQIEATLPCTKSQSHTSDLWLRMAWIYSTQGLIDDASKILQSRSKQLF